MESDVGSDEQESRFCLVEPNYPLYYGLQTIHSSPKLENFVLMETLVVGQSREKLKTWARVDEYWTGLFWQKHRDTLLELNQTIHPEEED